MTTSIINTPSKRRKWHSINLSHSIWKMYEKFDKILLEINLKYVLQSVTEAYVQRGTEIQFMCPTDLYLWTILLQFEQSVISICNKIYYVDKNYKDLVWHIFYW